jgi:ABC-2 type transport system permease protein
MDVRLLHYRAWRGDFRRPSASVWPIARVALGILFRRKLLWGLYAMGLLVFLLFFFGTALFNWAETQLNSTQMTIKVGRFEAEPERMIRSLRQGLHVLNGSGETYLTFFHYQCGIVIVVLTLAGSFLVGNDFTHNSLPFYLSKPLSRWHYLFGKCLAVAVVVNMLITLPCLVLYVQHGFDDWEYFTDPDFFVRNETGFGPAGIPLLLGILGYGLVTTAFLSLLLVATASWLRRTMPMLMVWAGLFLFLRALASALVDGLQYDPHWRLLDLWNDLRLAGAACLGLPHSLVTPRPQPSYLAAALVLGAVSLLCLTYLNLRTRAVEVVR